MTDPMTAGRRRMKLAARCRVATEAPAFGVVVFCAILLNAALMGAETYSGLASEYRQLLHSAEDCCLTLFTLEMLLRIGAYADRPKAFFRDPWNLFDLAIVVSAFVPLIRENTTLLRLLRLARVLRTARFLPHLRILLIAVGRSLPGTASSCSSARWCCTCTPWSAGCASPTRTRSTTVPWAAPCSPCSC